VSSPIDDLSLLGIDEPFVGLPPDNTVATAGDGQSSLAEVPGETA
jgi:hypothetical protein